MADTTYATLNELYAYMGRPVPTPPATDDLADLMQACLNAAAASISVLVGDLEEETVPDGVKVATLLQAARYFKRRESPYGIAGSPEMGSEMRLRAELDPDVINLVRPFRAWWAAAE